MIEQAQKSEAGSLFETIKSSKRMIEEVVEDTELETCRLLKSARTVYNTELHCSDWICFHIPSTISILN
jgi:hypothetical protein